MGKKPAKDRRRKSSYAPKKKPHWGPLRAIFPRMYINPKNLGDLYCVALFTQKGFRVAESRGYTRAVNFWKGRLAERPMALAPFEKNGPGTPEFDMSVLNRSGPRADFDGGPEDWDNWYAIPQGFDLGEGGSTSKEDEGESTSESDEPEAEVRLKPQAKHKMTSGHVLDNSGPPVMRIPEESAIPEVVIVVSVLKIGCC